MLRILFSRLGQPHIGSPQGFSFNIPSVSGSGAITLERGRPRPEPMRSVSRRDVPACEGHGHASDHIDLTELFDETKSLAGGAITIPGYTAGRLVDPNLRRGIVDDRQPHRDFTDAQGSASSTPRPQGQGQGINLTYEGLVPKIQKSMLSKDPESMQPHIRAFVERVKTFMACPERRDPPERDARVSKIPA